jgi:succinylglutamic semialdehyde dehydrogenase
MLSIKVLGDYIDGQFVRPRGAERKIVSHDPGDSGYRIGSFPIYPQHVDAALVAARQASPEWRRRDPADRTDLLRKFAAEVVNRRKTLCDLLSVETGKPLWEAEEEVEALAAQVEIEIREGVRTVSPFRISEVRTGVSGSCQFKPLGVVVVLGAAISPAHLACGQILPALLAGNTVVFKPSKLVPAVGQFLAELFEHIETPPGVFNLVQGDADAGWALAAHKDVDAVLFTGSYPTGKRILQATMDQPHKLVALQMGGINTAVVLADADLDQALYETVSGAYLTTGQRYTSTRQVIVEAGHYPKFAAAFVEAAAALKIGYAFDPEVFLGPMLSESARDRAIDLQERLGSLGLRTLLASEPVKPGRPGHYLSPAVFALEPSVRAAPFRPDGLFFGPQTVLVPMLSEEDGLRLANGTEAGFSATIFTRDADRFRDWAERLRYGLVNQNMATTETTMRLPLSGAGRCGNHRPAGLFSQRNCTFPVSSLCTDSLEPERRRPTFPKQVVRW